MRRIGGAWFERPWLISHQEWGWDIYRPGGDDAELLLADIFHTELHFDVAQTYDTCKSCLADGKEMAARIDRQGYHIVPRDDWRPNMWFWMFVASLIVVFGTYLVLTR